MVTGTEPSTTTVQEALEINYVGGVTVPNQTGSAERFALWFEADEANLTLYPLKQGAGDLLHADLTAEVTRESGDWCIGLVNDMLFGAYG